MQGTFSASLLGTQVKGDEAGEFAALLTEKLAMKSIHMDVICINDSHTKEAPAPRAANLNIIRQIVDCLDCQVRQVDAALELARCFRFKDTAHTAYYAGPMTIGGLMTIAVKVLLYEKLGTLPHNVPNAWQIPHGATSSAGVKKD